MIQNNLGKLYLVATPIGNLSDLSARALSTLHEVNFIAAEDTRVTRKLLNHLGIKKTLVSYYTHNSNESGVKIINRILAGECCALVTDAGTPGISDPGEDLVRLCIEAGIPMVSVPGPCAAIAALSMSGLPAARFVFEGFLHADKKKRLAHLETLKNEVRTMVFYEAPHKLLRTLSDMYSVFNDRRVSISREITKIYEETLRLTLSEAVIFYTTNTARGEFVLVVEGTTDNQANDIGLDAAVSAATKYIKEGSSVRDAVKRAADETGCSKNEIYRSIITTAP